MLPGNLQIWILWLKEEWNTEVSVSFMDTVAQSVSESEPARYTKVNCGVCMSNLLYP